MRYPNREFATKGSAEDRAVDKHVIETTIEDRYHGKTEYQPKR